VSSHIVITLDELTAKKVLLLGLREGVLSSSSYGDNMVAKAEVTDFSEMGDGELAVTIRLHEDTPNEEKI
jgi:hypothetical protein